MSGSSEITVTEKACTSCTVLAPMYTLYSACPVIVPSKPNRSSSCNNGFTVDPETAGFVYTVKLPRSPLTVCTVTDVISCTLKSLSASNSHKSIS